MNHVYKAFLLILLAVFVSSCGGEEKQDSSANVDEYVVKGENAAKELLALGNDSVKIQCQLLNVRSVEHSIRENGDNDQADAYVKAFEKYITTQNDSLAREIFGRE